MQQQSSERRLDPREEDAIAGVRDPPWAHNLKEAAEAEVLRKLAAESDKRAREAKGKGTGAPAEEAARGAGTSTGSSTSDSSKEKKKKKKYSSIDPREQKHAKDFSRLHPALATAPIFTAWRLSTTRTASASTRHLTAPAPAPSTQPAPAPCLHHVRSQLTCAASSQHRRPAPCLHHAHSQPASADTRHPAPPAPAPAPSTSTSNLSPPAPATCLESAHGQLVVI